jgi:hypothetical protein
MRVQWDTVLLRNQLWTAATTIHVAWFRHTLHCRCACSLAFIHTFESTDIHDVKRKYDSTMTHALVIVSTKMPPDLGCKKAIFKEQNFFCVVYHITQLGSCIITMVCPISQRFHDHYMSF